MKATKASHSVAAPYSVLGLSRNGCYAWQGGKPSARQQQNEALLDVIREEHPVSKGIYGSLRIHTRLPLTSGLRGDRFTLRQTQATL